MVTLDEMTLIHAPIERCFDLARSIEVHLLGNTHCGELAAAIGGLTSGLPGLGQRVTWRARHFALRHQLTSEITILEAPAHFQDVQVRGPFRFLRHDRFFERIAPERTAMRDVFCFAAPLPVVGRCAEVLVLRRYMRTLLQERNAVIRRVAESCEWRRYLS